jgi:nucleoside-diphosphate-sugar epimerase
MKVLVTGGTGLVGSHVIERLVQRGDQVVAPVRREEGRAAVESLGARSALGAVEDGRTWELAADVDAIVHTAAIVVQSAPWERYRTVNVDSVRLAAEAAARAGARLVHISSVAVYGRGVDLAPGEKIAEDLPFRPIADADFYARSKRLAEETLWATAQKRGLRAAALRPCVIYGERERIFMARVLRMLRTGLVPLVGRGDNHLSVVYAGNVAGAVLAALDRPEVEGPFNITNDGGITQREFFETIGAAAGRRLRFVRLPMWAALAAGHAWHWWRRLTQPGRYAGIGGSGARFLRRENPFISAKAEAELEWRPATAPRDALRRTVEWFVGERGPT